MRRQTNRSEATRTGVAGRDGTGQKDIKMTRIDERGNLQCQRQHYTTA